MRNALLFSIAVSVLLLLWRVAAPAYPAWLPYAVIVVIGGSVVLAFLTVMGLTLTLPEAWFDRLEAS